MGSKLWLVVCCQWVQLWLTLTDSCRAASNDYYTAGVIEFRPAMGASSSADQLAENMVAYEELINMANGTADILVFPEGTLNTVLQLTAVPMPSKHSLCQREKAVNDALAPAAATDDAGVANFLQQLACAAVDANSYLVLNVKEREECVQLDADCPERGYLLYNTNVVLNRQGAVVSRYRKWNLYLEPQLNRTKMPEHAVFVTDFNVTFGHFVCFDMLFYTPAQEIIEQYNVRNVIVSNMFNSELPFLTASQLQQGWAWANNVNLLIAGASIPQAGITGSGIYAGQHGALVRRMVGDAAVGERELLLAHVPLHPDLPPAGIQPDIERREPAQRLLKMLQQPQLTEFNSMVLPMFNGRISEYHLCQADLCCTFEVNLQLDDLEVPQIEYCYRLGAFVGQRRYEEEQYSVIRLCGLFACRNASVESCGLLSEPEIREQVRTPVRFTTLHIIGDFVRRKRRLIMPSTLSEALYALQSTEMQWDLNEAKELTHVELQLKKPHAQLLTFGIYGNYFDEYKQGEGDGGGGGVTARLWRGMLIGLLLLYLIVK